MEHVITHAVVDKPSIGHFRCQWDVTPSPVATAQCTSFEPCGTIVVGYTQRQRHLYRHTGLPYYVCDKCRVCFMEMPTFEEHFKWSISDQRGPNTSTDAGKTLPPLDGSTEQISNLNLLQCEHCGKRFVTKHGLSGHMRCCRIKRLRKGVVHETVKPVKNRKSHTHPGKRVAHSNSLVTEAGCELEQAPKRYICPVEGCTYETELYSAYRYHFKRYHSTVNPDGLWYACHLCSDYRTRKPTTMACHFRTVHRLAPPPGRRRFAYLEDPIDGVYRLVDKPPAPKPNVKRPILPAITAISTSSNAQGS
ncbi:unnamed protein product [Echinostoma caproni]|uniref:C2H2-type domain-containing protein n=1 Tax=Echinostoma caproni TaxID=27848 RepID=A0A183B031_9TREM|nr:unnamed protein product [Echinostoma caproni]